MPDADQASPAVPSSVPGHPPLGPHLHCPECGYSLRGLTSRRCPECGLALDFIESDKPLIPWERRREIGRLRAYWQTVLMVMFRTRLFCRAICRPVSYRAAQRFRWVCVLHAFVPLAMAVPILWAFDYEPLFDVLAQVGAWFIGIVYACVLLVLLALTGLPSYFFHPRSLGVEQQNRAIALSYYGCAALAWTPPALVILCAVFAVDRPRWELGLLAAALLLALLLGWWLVLLRIARRTLRRPGAVLRVAVLVVPLWLVVGGLTLVVPLVAVLYVWLIADSLR